MTPATWETLRAAMDRAQVLLCDWDGCLAIENRLLPGVADVLRAGPPFAIVSNNSTLPRAAYRAMVAAQGLPIAERHIHLAGDSMLREVARLHPHVPVQVVGEPAMRDHARALGLRLIDSAPDLVLLLRDTRFDFATLERTANHIARGARFWMANGDVSHPTRQGMTPETGALAAAISAMVGRGPDRNFGKPSPFLFRAALAALDASPSAALMIGDNPATDLAGADALGMASCLIGSATWGRSSSGDKATGAQGCHDGDVTTPDGLPKCLGQSASPAFRG